MTQFCAPKTSNPGGETDRERNGNRRWHLLADAANAAKAAKAANNYFNKLASSCGKQ